MEAPTRLSCPACGKYFKVRKYNPSSRVSCPDCKGPLVEPVGPTPGPLGQGQGWEIPVRLGRYRIGSEIARGGMGVVYRAEQEGLNRPIAIKMMLPHLAGQTEHVHRFMREARAAAKLKHPNIVAIHEIGDYRNVPFFSMDYVDGKGLDEVAGGPLPVKRASEIARDVARAIHYAHEQGIVHRDIKPGNILLDREGAPRVTDFGLAKDLDARSMLSVTGDILGTPSYMSPEQAQGFNREIDRRTDIYSLGVVLYRLLVGKDPFEGNTYADTIFKLVHQDPVDPARLNKHVPEDLAAVVLKAMEKRPAERYATAAALADDLDRFLAGEPVLATRPSPFKRFRRRLAKNRAAAGIAGGAVAAAVIGIVVMFFVLGRSELDLIEENLRVPAMRLQALGALFEGMADGRYGSESPRAFRLAVSGMPPGADAETREAAIGAAERHGTKLDAFLDTGGRGALLEWMDGDPPRVIRLFAARKDRGAVSAVCRWLRPDAPKDARLEAVRFCQAVPDAREYYGLGTLLADRDVGAEARIAMQAQYANRVVGFFNPAVGNLGGALAEMGREIAKYQQQIDDLMEPPGSKPQGPKDSVELAILKLGDPDAAVRLQAAYELGEHKDARGRAPLLAALGDDDPGVADVAGLSLGAIGLGESEPAVVARLRDEKASTRRAAAIALGRAAAKGAKQALEDAFKVERDERVKDALLDAMTRIR